MNLLDIFPVAKGVGGLQEKYARKIPKTAGILGALFGICISLLFGDPASLETEDDIMQS